LHGGFVPHACRRRVGASLRVGVVVDHCDAGAQQLRRCVYDDFGLPLTNVCESAPPVFGQWVEGLAIVGSVLGIVATSLVTLLCCSVCIGWV